MARFWRLAFLGAAILIAVAAINVSASPHAAAHAVASTDVAPQKVVPLGGISPAIELECVKDPGAAGGCLVPRGTYFRSGCTTTASVLVPKDSFRWVSVSLFPGAYCIGEPVYLPASHGTVWVSDENF